jgi:glutamine---fructose-6-phosphate transaminase (isomerizing)
MCGIFGIIAQPDSDAGALGVAITQLFLLSQSRGSEASGFAYTNGHKIIVHRSPEPAGALIKQQEFRHAIGTLHESNHGFVFIGHSRLATNGSQYIDANNQPVVTKAAIMVHNGIIVNAADLWKKYYNKKTIPELDTLVATQVLDKTASTSLQKGISRLFREIEGEASIALISRKNPHVFLATNTGSIYHCTLKNGTVIFSSERYITQRTLDAINESGKITRLQPNDVKQIKIPHAPTRYAIQKREVKSFAHARLFENSLTKLKTHAPDYAAIEKIPRCTKCILPITMPLISFDKDGVCNFCRTYTPQKPRGEKALEQRIAPFRSKNGDADCIVALSGGRDSSYGLHYAKTVLGLNPMAYTYDWGMVTDIARRNQSRMVSKLGVEHIWVSANIEYKRRNIRKNVEAWLAKPDIAMVPLFMAGDKQAEYYVEELKRKTGIKLVIYCRGNQLEDERFKFGYYGIFDGTPGGVIHNLSWGGKMAMAAYFAAACISNPRYINLSLLDTAFAYASSYLVPHRDFLYLWHYIPWEEKHLIQTLKTKYDWETPTDTVATWRIDDGTPPFYNYIYYHIQGFTEHDGLRSNQVREGHIARREALRLATAENRPRYESLKWYFDTIGINGDKALKLINNIPTQY